MRWLDGALIRCWMGWWDDEMMRGWDDELLRWWDDKILNQTINNLLKIYSSLKLSSEINESQIVSNPINTYEDYFQNKKQEINAYINNDFNTPAALSVIFELVKKFNLLAVNKKVTPEIKFFSEKFDDFFVLYGGIFGLFQEKRSNFLKSLNNLLLKSRGITEDYINTKIKINFSLF